MDSINNIINRYHYRFNSYKGIITVVSIWTWIMVVSFSAACLCLAWHLNFITIECINISQGYKLSLSMVLIFIGFLNIIRFTALRDESVIEYCQEKFNVKIRSLAHARMVWLKTYLPYKRSEYLILAENIDSALTLRTKYKYLGEVSKEGLVEYLLTSDSKNRLLAMFMGLSTFVIALSIAYGSSIENVFEFYKSATTKDFVNFFIFIPLFFFIGVLELKIFINLVSWFMELLFDNLNGINGFSYLRSKTFINELIRLYSFEKPRIRVIQN